MIEKSTLKFLEKLSANNNREWFAEHRKEYELAKNNFTDFINELIPEINQMDNFITDVDAKNSIFRIFKDVRFSKDKSPYKTNFGAAICKGGRKSEYPGYYLHIMPNGETFVGGGIYHPQAAVLNAIRKEIEFNTNQFYNIIHAKSFQNTFGQLKGDSLSRPPKGFDKEHPAIEDLKRKDFLMLHKVKDEQVTQSNFKQYCLEQFSKMKPLDEFFRGPVFDVIEKE